MANNAQGYNDAGFTRGRARVGGSGFTLFRWNWKGADAASVRGIMFARSVTDQTPAPVGAGTTPIHPMDSTYPEHLITPVATSMGTLTLEVYELLGKTPWGHLEGISSANDLAAILSRVAEDNSSLSVHKHVFKPSNTPGKHRPERTGEASDLIASQTMTYHNCVVSQVMDGETIEVGTMDVLKQIVLNYTHYTRQFHS